MGDIREGESWTWGQKIRNDAIYAGAMTILAASQHLSSSQRLRFGRTLGRSAARWMPAARARAEQRLHAAFEGRPPIGALDAFEGMGEVMADTVALLNEREPVDRTLRLSEGAAAVVVEAAKTNRGVVFATAHLGPIDRMAALVASLGLKVATLVRESYDPRFNALYERLRRPRGVLGIYRGRPGAATAMVRVLRSGGLLGFPMDLAGRGMPTLSCRFLGEQSPVPTGPARIALRTGAVVLVGSPAPGPAGGLEVTVERLDHIESEEALTRALAANLERRILSLPKHWPWMHGSR